MEAMSAGLLVISTRHSGIPELVQHGKTGFLADEGDVDDLSHVLGQALAQRDRLNPVVDAARKTVETKFHVDRQSSELVGWINELATNKAGSQPSLTSTH